MNGFSIGTIFRDNCNTLVIVSDSTVFDLGKLLAASGADSLPLEPGDIIASGTPDVKRIVQFYTQVMGLRFSDSMEDFFYFLRCGADHHTINLLSGDYSAVQHFAFELADISHITSACDTLAREKVEILWGPLRHGCGHNIAFYHFDPEGLIIEHCAELDRMSNEGLGISTLVHTMKTVHNIRRPGPRRRPLPSGAAFRLPSCSIRV